MVRDKQTKRPNNRRNLDLALERLYGKAAFPAKRAVMANAIVAQMLPDGLVKGGSAIKMRLGDGATRYTTDLDIARASTIEEFASELDAALKSGWEGFAGSLVAGRRANPKGVPAQYVMQPFQVKLSYNTKPWMTVDLEVGHNEIGDAETPDFIVPADANEVLQTLGFPAIGPVPVMPLKFQIAQKLHAVSALGNERAHDLIDLQLIAEAYGGDYADVKATCKRLFAYRKMQTWPPVVKAGSDWETLYSRQLPAGDLLRTVDEAVAWANELIARIDAS